MTGESFDALRRFDLSYLATPYSRYPGGIEKAFADAASLAGRLFMLGIHVFSPIAHGHPLSVHGGVPPLNHNLWLEYDEKLMEVCDALIIAELDGWLDSEGIQYERDVFEAADKPVFYIEPKTLEVRR